MHVSRLLTRTLAQLRDVARGERPASAGRVSPARRSSALDARGWNDPGQHDERDHGQRRPRRRVVSPPRKLHASPSWISWASTTGPRAQERRRAAPRRRAAARRRTPGRRRAVVSPIVSRSPRQADATSSDREHQQRARALDGHQRTAAVSERRSGPGGPVRPDRRDRAAGHGSRPSHVVTASDHAQGLCSGRISCDVWSAALVKISLSLPTTSARPCSAPGLH